MNSTGLVATLAFESRLPLQLELEIRVGGLLIPILTPAPKECRTS